MVEAPVFRGQQTCNSHLRLYYDTLLKFNKTFDIMMPQVQGLCLYSHNKAQSEDALKMFLIIPFMCMFLMCICIMYISVCVCAHARAGWATFQRETSKSHLSEHTGFFTPERCRLLMCELTGDTWKCAYNFGSQTIRASKQVYFYGQNKETQGIFILKSLEE